MILAALLLQEIAPAAEDGGTMDLVAYAILVAGVLDLAFAAFIAFKARQGTEDTRRMVAGILGLSGLGMIALGVAIRMGLIRF